MATLQNQSKRNQDVRQGNQSQPAGNQFNKSGNTRSDVRDEGGESEDDKRTGTSVAGNTASDRFNSTAEHQQTDRDKNAEG